MDRDGRARSSTQAMKPKNSTEPAASRRLSVSQVTNVQRLDRIAVLSSSSMLSKQSIEVAHIDAVEAEGGDVLVEGRR